MIAFIKRRWLLFSCAVVLLACSFFDWQRVARIEISPLLGNSLFEEYEDLEEHGIKGGAYCVVFFRDGCWDFLGRSGHFRVHHPQLGSLPTCELGNRVVISIPLWLPLSAVLGWLVVRELCWREKRARKAEQP